MRLRPFGRLSPWMFPAVLCAFLLAATWSVSFAQQRPAQQPKPLSSLERGRTENMLGQIHAELKKAYYDPKFHGIDVDQRYKEYQDRLKKVQTLGDAYRVVAAYLAGLDDSHTFFVPPRRSYRVEYGYRMQIIGDRTFITEVRPGWDAANKLHSGDEILDIGPYTVNRKDLWQIQYYMNQIAPQPATAFTLRDPSGKVRHEMVATKFKPGNRVKQMDLEHGDSDFWQLILQEEQQEHLLRNRYVEIGNALIWQLPVFTGDETALDHMLDIARKHDVLILDLRGNPGGLVSSLDMMVGSVMDHDVTIGKRITRKGEKEQAAKSRGGAVFHGKLFVLVDSRSASAAELFARIVQLEHRGTVVGDRTSGMVMESIYHPFQDGGTLNVGYGESDSSLFAETGGVDEGIQRVVLYGASITDADIVMTDGKSLEKNGVTPDVIVLPTAADLAAGRDPALAKAAELAGIKLDPAAAGKMFPYEWPPE